MVDHAGGLQLSDLSLDPLPFSPEAGERLGRPAGQLDIEAGGVTTATTASCKGRVS